MKLVDSSHQNTTIHDKKYLPTYIRATNHQSPSPSSIQLTWYLTIFKLVSQLVSEKGLFWSVASVELQPWRWGYRKGKPQWQWWWKEDNRHLGSASSAFTDYLSLKLDDSALKWVTHWLTEMKKMYFTPLRPVAIKKHDLIKDWGRSPRNWFSSQVKTGSVYLIQKKIYVAIVFFPPYTALHCYIYLISWEYTVGDKERVQVPPGKLPAHCAFPKHHT